MTYLVDANILSEAVKPEPSASVVSWLRAHERNLVIDSIILGEIRFGILLLPRGKRRERLEAWFQSGVARITCLTWDAPVGMRWAALLADLRRRGHSIPIKDSLIAATALHHGLTIATRNTRDFKSASVPTIDPFASPS